MSSPVVKHLRTLFVAALLITIIGTAIDSLAQDQQGLTIIRGAQRLRPVHRLHHSPQAPTSTPTWSLMIPSFTTSELFFETLLSEHSAVYDPTSNTMIVFGGLTQDNSLRSATLIDTNANGSAGMEGGSWTELDTPTTPPARVYHTAVYDQTNNRMIVFGGCADQYCHVPLNDTWVLTNANGNGGAPTWTQLAPTGTLPSPRYYQNAVYDETNNRMIVYGGETANLTDLTDVWVLSNANGLTGTPTWAQLSPTGPVPDAFVQNTAVYDPNTNTLIIFGGITPVNSVWTLSNANGMSGTPVWTNIVPKGAKGAPPARSEAQAIYDPTTNRMTIFGGTGDFGTTNPDFDFGTYNDVWVLANANGSGGTPTWIQLHPKFNGDGFMQPGTRALFSAVRDPNTNSMIIFGGINVEAAYGAPWVLSHANGQ